MAVIEHLVVDRRGAYIGKHSERLRVTAGKEHIVDAPLFALESVLVAEQGVSISSDAIAACAYHGIPIHFVSGNGHAYAALYSAGLTGTVTTRRAQLLAYSDRRGVAAAMAFARGKISNQAALLRYIAKYRKETDPSLYEQLRMSSAYVLDGLAALDSITATTIDEARGVIMAAEGRAAQEYWQGIKAVLPADLNWPGRKGQGAQDPVNAALNYGYAILAGQVERALTLAGLDPYAGFLHVDRPGKSSLTFDFMEEFRPVAVDRAIVAIFTRGTQLAVTEAGRFDEGSCRIIQERIYERLESDERYAGKRFPLRQVIQMQARQLVTALRGERDAYEPFSPHW